MAEQRRPTVLPPARHEPRDIAFKPMLIGFLATGLVLAGLVLLPLWLFPHAASDKSSTFPPSHFAAPQLQPSPRADMQRFYAAEMQRLNSIGWVDEPHGIVHIPIDDAMQRIAEKGIADWPTKPMRDVP